MNRRPLLLAAGMIAASCAGFFVGRSHSLISPVPADVPIASQQTVASADAVEQAMQPKALKPVIGIASLTSDSYVRAIRECGGVPIVLPNTDGSVDRIDDYLELLDGLLMPGGADIRPSEWNEEQHPTTKLLDDDRFEFEKAMITAWIQRTKKPLLGICLGSQWINVAHGGSLVQDIPSEFGVNHRGVSHAVIVEADSRLREILGQTEFEVNSLHHQAVRNVGKGLRAVAKSPDGIIEATETADPHRFLFGVQWHPEKLVPEDRLQQKLIQAFVDAALKDRT